MLRTTIAALVTTSGMWVLLATAASPAPDVTSEIVALERQVMDGWLKGNR